MGKWQPIESSESASSALAARQRAAQALAEIEITALKMQFSIEAIRAALDTLPPGAIPTHEDRDKALL